ncbi:MAG: IS1595 family transposase [Acidobacteriaceae bacterium]
MNLIDVTKQFATDEQCLEYLEAMRWPDGVRCPTCGAKEVSVITRATPGKNKRGRIYQCLEPTCKQQFSATAGTIFHDSHLPLTKWFMALAMVVDAKKGISARQLQEHLGIGSYRTAWYMAHHIRKAMEETGSPFLSGTVEIDETYVGGKQRGKGVWFAKNQKEIVMGAIERGGKLRFKHVDNTKAKTIREFVKDTVSEDVQRIITDEYAIYVPALQPKLTAIHETIQHKSRVYVRGDVYTNTIESAFSLLKRGIIGSFHKVSIKHLHRYLSEFEYRFNSRKVPDRFEQTLRRMLGIEAMPYKQLIAEEKA